ncbi:2-polyprenylphenol 6-hydroxylase [Luminiphilus syltensis NOR5-1B]|uniref:2-polyprenylphenol 6-hydroxylase n=1 Tax=Luminiphilus syltensis NOR5-1B TaxID=565045 RepID=B8KUS2_9GAMM|nr:ubiquinone biosynthesis regulatory protein kinase UbiB [Luminiphilus syltensis]EED34772.1 2-polyprenylphenol 6-hydroxylase [Luminiphilus syltensis NOR5-1B]
MIRLFTLYRVAAYYRLDEFLPEDRRGKILRGILRLHPKARAAIDDARGVRLRRALEDLGPVFIKFGQLLSTRRDLLPDDIARELALLQDTVPPFASDTAQELIESALGSPIDSLFARFDREPLAAASVAQVHSAQLPTGDEVVVKVLRPDILPVINADLKLIKIAARWVAWLMPEGRRLRAREVAADYERTLLDELDLRREAANASQLRRNFLDSDLIMVPAVIWPLTRQTVMVSERIYGVPVTDVDTLRERGVNMRVLAERGVEIFFTQVLRDSFFHADMHPGNIFVDTSNPERPKYIAIDCAIVGQLEQDDLYYLARNLLAIFEQDYRLVARLHVECGWVPPDTPIAEFESAMRALCEPVFERPLGDISFGGMLVSLFRTAGRFDMQVQPQLVLLQKTLLNIEGLGRQLYPELNLWDTAKPFLERWLAERYSPQNLLRRIQQEAPSILETLPQLPDLALSRLREPLNSPAPAARPWAAAVMLVAGGFLVSRGYSVYPDDIPGLLIGLILIAAGTFSLKR